MLDFREALNEKKSIRIDSANFSVHPYDDWTVIFMPTTSADLDVIGLMGEEYREKILKYLEKKTKIEWFHNYKYEGAGYAFQVNKYSFVVFLTKLLK